MTVRSREPTVARTKPTTFMHIDWVKFLPALLLLLTPISLFQGKRVRFRGLDQSWDDYWKRAAALGLHSIDVLRAAIGAWWLAESFKAAPGAAGLLRYAPLAAQFGLLCLATTVQTMVCKERDSANAPFAFAAGLVIGYLPPLTSTFALIIAFVVAFGARMAPIFFPFLSAAIVGLGLLLNGKKFLYTLISVACAIALPWLLCLLFPRTLVVAYWQRRKVPLADHR